MSGVQPLRWRRDGSAALIAEGIGVEYRVRRRRENVYVLEERTSAPRSPWRLAGMVPTFDRQHKAKALARRLHAKRGGVL